VSKEVLSAQVVAPATVTDFLVEMRTVTGTTKKVLATSSMSSKFKVLQEEGRREMTLDRPTTHKLVKRLLQHCKGIGLYDLLAYIETETGGRARIEIP
jgi:hypothetical protein